MWGGGKEFQGNEGGMGVMKVCVRKGGTCGFGATLLFGLNLKGIPARPMTIPAEKQPPYSDGKRESH